MSNPDYNNIDALATLACFKGMKKPGCVCLSCAGRASLFGSNLVAVAEQEARREALARGDIKSLKEAANVPK